MTVRSVRKDYAGLGAGRPHMGGSLALVRLPEEVPYQHCLQLRNTGHGYLVLGMPRIQGTARNLAGATGVVARTH